MLVLIIERVLFVYRSYTALYWRHLAGGLTACWDHVGGTLEAQKMLPTRSQHDIKMGSIGYQYKAIPNQYQKINTPNQE